MIGTRLRAALTVVALIGLSAPAPAAAQLCQGVPLGIGAAAVAGFLGVGSDASSRAGGTIRYQVAAPLALSAGYGRTRHDGSDAAATLLRAGAVVPAVSFGDGDAARVSMCAAAGAARERSGDLTVLTVPMGVAAGLELPLAPRLVGVLHVEPRVVYTRSDVAGFSRSAHSPGARGGVSLVWRGLFAGASYEWVRARNRNTATTLLLGARVGRRDGTRTRDSGSQP